MNPLRYIARRWFGSRKADFLGEGDYFQPPHDTGRRVLLLGGYGSSNFGDELMLEMLLERFQTDSGLELSVVFDPGNRNYDINRWPGVHPFYPPLSERSIAKIVDFYDEIVIGGGAFLDDRGTSIDRIAYLAMRLSEEAIRRGKVVRWIAVSANETLSAKYLERVRFVSSNAAEFSVRDDNSLRLLHQAGIVETVSKTDDIVFGLDVSARTLCLTLIDYNSRELLKCLVSDVIDVLVRHKERKGENWRICFLPFNHRNHHDAVFLADLTRGIDFQGIQHGIAPETLNLESMLMLMKGADAFINMRYHASVISLKLGIPTLSICLDTHRHYRNKMHYLHTYFKNDCLIDVSTYSSPRFQATLEEILSKAHPSCK